MALDNLNPWKKKIGEMSKKDFENYINILKNDLQNHMSWLLCGFDSKIDDPTNIPGNLRERLEQLNTENINQTYTTIVNQLDSITTQSNKVKEEILEKLEELESFKNKCDKLEEVLKEKESQLAIKDQELYNKDLEITKLNSENETIKKQALELFEKATESAKDKDSKIGSLECRLEIAKEKANENGDKLAEKEQQLAVEEKKSHELSIELRGKERELRNVKEEAKATNDAQVEKIAKRDQKIQQLNEDITSLDKKIKETKEELENTQRTLTSTERKLSSDHETIEVKEKENTSLSRSLERKETDLEKVTKESENFASEMNETYGGVGGLVSPYVVVAKEILSCDSTKEILEKYLPIENVENQILFIRHVGRGEGLAQEIYNTMRRNKSNNKEPMNSAEEKMIQTLNKFYQENDHLEFDILYIPQSEEKFDKKFVQDLEKPSNTSFLKYTDVYVPAVMKDEKM